MDILEIDYKYYLLLLDKTIETRFVEDSLNKKGEDSLFRGLMQTTKEIKANGDTLGVLKVLERRTPDWTCLLHRCECGSRKVYGEGATLHSTWCPAWS